MFASLTAMLASSACFGGFVITDTEGGPAWMGSGFTVDMGGDELMFDSLEEAKAFIDDEVNSNPDWYESLGEDTIKQDGKWVNKGDEGTHGKFKTKKAADAQRKAMFANGYKGESLDEAKDKWTKTPYGFSEMEYNGYTITHYDQPVGLFGPGGYPYTVDFYGDETGFESLEDAKAAIDDELRDNPESWPMGSLDECGNKFTNPQSPDIINTDNGIQDESLNESDDLQNIPLVDKVNFSNVTNNRMPGLVNVKALVAELERIASEVGPKFKIRSTRFGNNVSYSDIRDEWMTLKKLGWSIYRDNDPSIKGFNEVYVCSRLANESLDDESLTEAETYKSFINRQPEKRHSAEFIKQLEQQRDHYAEKGFTKLAKKFDRMIELAKEPVAEDCDKPLGEDTDGFKHRNDYDDVAWDEETWLDWGKDVDETFDGATQRSDMGSFNTNLDDNYEMPEWRM